MQADQGWVDAKILGSNYEVQLLYETNDGRETVTGLKIVALEGAITNTLLRRIRMSDLRSAAREATEIGPTRSYDLEKLVLGAMPSITSEKTPTSGRRRRSDEEWARIAGLYVLLCEQQEPNVTEAMAKTLDVKPAYVPKLLHRCTERGMLTGRQQGLKGGDLTDKALQALGHEGSAATAPPPVQARRAVRRD